MSGHRADRTISELVEAFTELGPAWVRWVNACLPAENVSFARMRVLTELYCGGELTMTELANHLDVSPRRVTDLVDALASEDLVERKANPFDARSTVVAITPSGTRQHQVGWQQHQTAVGLAFTDLTAKERQELLAISRSLTAALHARLEPGPRPANANRGGRRTPARRPQRTSAVGAGS
jgi:DNA-binding MarR family transcriptional regulator